MKINKNRSLIASVLCLTVALLFASGITACNATNNTSSLKETDSKENIKPDNVSFKSDIAYLAEKDNILKIESINSGLDAADITVIMYDLNTEKIISTTPLGAKEWETGQINNGFYAIDIKGQEVFVYDVNGKQINNFKYSENAECSGVCGISDDGKYMLYTNALTGEMYIYNIEKRLESKVGNSDFYNQYIGYRDNNFYVGDFNGEIAKISTLDNKLTTAVIDIRISDLSPYYAIGNGANDKVVVSVNENKCKYLTSKLAEKETAQIGSYGFATFERVDNVSKIYVFDIENSKMLTFEDKGIINRNSIYYLGDGKLLTASKNENEGNFGLNVLTVTESKNIEFSDKESVSADSVKKNTEKLIANVPVIGQYPNFPTGCEAVSTVMALNYAGKNITVDDFINNFLPMSNDFYTENGKNYGPDPNKFFVGNPKSKSSFGCMAPVIEKALKECLDDDFSIINTTNSSLDKLCTDYIDKDIPVITWVTMNMVDTQPIHTWYLESGERFAWPGNEHCMLLIGYDDDKYYFNDPAAAKVQAYEKALVENHYAEIGSQSIAVIKK